MTGSVPELQGATVDVPLRTALVTFHLR